MILSQNEVLGLATKAARGAGFPSAQAQEFGAAACFLTAAKHDIAPISAALQEPVTQPVVTWQPDHVRIDAGPAILIAPIVRDAFAMGLDRAQFSNPMHAALIGAMLACDDVSATWDVRSVMRSDTNVVPPPAGPVDLAQAHLTLWQGLAAQTYVPESDLSRARGAGEAAAITPD